MEGLRSFKNYKEEVANRVDKERLIEWCYSMSRQLIDIEEYAKNSEDSELKSAIFSIINEETY